MADRDGGWRFSDSLNNMESDDLPSIDVDNVVFADLDGECLGCYVVTALKHNVYGAGFLASQSSSSHVPTEVDM